MSIPTKWFHCAGCGTPNYAGPNGEQPGPCGHCGLCDWQENAPVAETEAEEIRRDNAKRRHIMDRHLADYYGDTPYERFDITQADVDRYREEHQC